jgi:hypothetical protein
MDCDERDKLLDDLVAKLEGESKRDREEVAVQLMRRLELEYLYIGMNRKGEIGEPRRISDHTNSLVELLEEITRHVQCRLSEARDMYGDEGLPVIHLAAARMALGILDKIDAPSIVAVKLGDRVVSDANGLHLDWKQLCEELQKITSTARGM